MTTLNKLAIDKPKGFGMMLEQRNQNNKDTAMAHKKNPAAVALGKLGKGKTSEKKKKSSQENGKKGGRPRNPNDQDQRAGPAPG